MKICFLTTFMMLIGNVIIAQIISHKQNPFYNKVFVTTDNFDSSYLDILETNLNNAPADTTRFSMLNDLAYYWHTRNLNKAMTFTNLGLQQTATQKDELWNGRFKITQGAILLRMEKLDSALLVLTQARPLVHKEDIPFLNTQIGYVFERKGDLSKAADYALKSLDLGEELDDKKAIALAYSDLSNIFWKQSKFDEGLQYGLKSVKIFEERGIQDLDYDFTLYVVGNNYLALGNTRNALKFYNNAIRIGERYGFYNNLSDVYISLAELYTYLNDFDKASFAGMQAVKYARFLDNNFMLMRSWLAIGKLQFLEGKYLQAIENLTKSIVIATADFGDEYYLSQAYEYLAKAHAEMENYEKAYIAYLEYDKLVKMIFTAEADERIALLQTEFDVAQKENTIQLQQDLLKKQQIRQVLISIISGLLLFILLGLYKITRDNRKKNKLLQRQNQEKEFLLKEIHHRVKNNLEIVSSLLALQSSQISDPNVVDVMKESQHRVQSMSMIHKKLYKGKNLAAIEMKDYFMNLGNYILHSFGLENRVNVNYDMSVLELDVEKALPIGLIVNELLTNSLKYAFPENREGSIIISLKEYKSRLQLLVSDNGVGSENINRKKTGFGTQLIDLLTKQLDGRMTKNMTSGTTLYFEFLLHKTT
ncbi:histidine kinase [Gillisia sp. M10.2A]|uniref:histidine kinase n=1 Tax=Gillisia lutea TaxID=2909668 RepID=A0ABS9EI47_9FLAO|nr:histidine kinase dimerization/phosphoacceptor domain -containing protein [Gillisia lutea]MCF4102537.1 histidine kinase [Gillisia lutea]